ncbi:MAG: pirin family protein [Leptospirales bacterium]|jgi:redox-sensitive bicupin YhaK (pirin superfamily)
MATTQSRPVDRVIKGTPVQDGAGVQLKRILGTPALDHLDPFLMLDEFRSDDSNDYVAGFPPHPHRGFETVTYMKKGRFRHKDSRGNEGLLVDGSVQWMTAGRGIIHSEMPEMTDGLLWGYQLWINLPARHKMIDPRYQDIGPERIPLAEKADQSVRVIAGEYAGIRGPAETLIPVNYFDVELRGNAHFEHAVPAGWNCFSFVYEGAVRGDPTGSGRRVEAGELMGFGPGEAIHIQNEDSEPAGFLFLAAERIEEPIARHGPFVMNTEDEIIQAFVDFQNGTLHR